MEFSTDKMAEHGYSGTRYNEMFVEVANYAVLDI
jgi:hypothetical protein